MYTDIVGVEDRLRGIAQIAGDAKARIARVNRPAGRGEESIGWLGKGRGLQRRDVGARHLAAEIGRGDVPTDA